MAVLNQESTQIIGTVVKGQKLVRSRDGNATQASVDHIIQTKRSSNIVLLKTARKQLVVFIKTGDSLMLGLPASCFRTT